MLTDEEMFNRMRYGWRAGRSDGTVCGNGSMLHHTANIRNWLPEMVERFGIQRVCDAGAGDMHWIAHLRWAVDYRPYDIVIWHPEVQRLDITKDPLPECDAILCRMVLNHLGDDPDRIVRALALFRQSARFLIATQFDGENLPQRSPQFQRLDLRRAPYFLGRPLEQVQDGAEAWCSLALWRL